MEEKKKLEFYGGAWMSFLPFVIFLVLIVLTTFHFGSISDGALWLPAFLALIVAFFFAKNKRQYAETMIAGMASKEAIIPVVCWLFAGVFSRILRESGLAAGVAGIAAGIPACWPAPSSRAPHSVTIWRRFRTPPSAPPPPRGWTCPGWSAPG